MIKEVEIIWSPQAELTYFNILDHILTKWTIREAVAFDDKVEGLFAKLKTFKNLCPVSDKQKHYRKCLITKQSSVVYQVVKDNIELITFIYNRSDHPF